jgi:hypothetical protein
MTGKQTLDKRAALQVPGGSWWAEPLDRFANLDDSLHGFTELRVYGVSGPLPGSVLQFPEPVVTLVNGNADSGFWRRWRLGGPHQDEPDSHHLEGFCWGGLTSRAHWQALWLLVLPFTLVNIAHWMLLPHDGKTGSATAMRWAIALLRLLALSFTVTLMFSAAEVTMDVGAWQCGPDANCQVLPGWLTGWHLGIRVAVGGGLVAVLLSVLWVTGQARFSPLKLDKAPDPVVPRAGDGQATDPVLADPAFWAVDTSTVWLRCLHVGAWCAGIGALATGAVIRAAAPSVITIVLFWINIAVLAAASGLVLFQWFGRGGRGPKPGIKPPEKQISCGMLVLLGGSLAAAAVDLPDSAASTHPVLPNLRSAIGWLALGQIAALIVLAILIMIACRPGQRWKEKWIKGYRPMLHGFLPLAFAWLGWFIGLTLTAGIGLWVATRLGKAPPGSQVTPKISAPPAIYYWIDSTAVLVAFVIVIALIIILIKVLASQGKIAERKIEEEEELQDRAAEPQWRSRARSAARLQILAQSVEGISALLLSMTVASATIAAIAAYRYFLYGATRWFWPSGWLAWVPQVGAWVIVTGTIGVVVLAYAAFRNQSTRRLVGIIWDVSTFWPRANHPLTPPCSAERAVPQLADRIKELNEKETDCTVVSAHSQGSVLAAAAILRLAHGSDPRIGVLKHVSLLTYGNPLRRLYARSFPAYFSEYVLRAVSDSLPNRWTNLWAETDPIGGNIFTDTENPQAARRSTCVKDVLMTPDPLTLEDDPRSFTKLKVCDHSGFRDRPEYQEELDSLKNKLG